MVGTSCAEAFSDIDSNRLTQNHVRILQETMDTLGLDSEAATPGRVVVKHIGESLVEAMDLALQAGQTNLPSSPACDPPSHQSNFSIICKRSAATCCSLVPHSFAALWANSARAHA